MAEIKITPVILAGGSGTRLWPLSRETYPKQLLSLHGDGTLLQATARRLDGLQAQAPDCEVCAPLLVCNEEHRFVGLEQLDAIAHLPAAVILEPVGRNTAPALTLAALQAGASGDDPILLVMPADHVIQDQAEFLAAVEQALRVAAEDRIVTFGIVPDHPETGFGYLRAGEPLTDGGGSDGVCRLAEFVEKPEAENAARYVESGEHLWNSGMFMVRASVWLAAIGEFVPAIAQACEAAIEGATRDGYFLRVEREAFKRCPSDSIDYAVMEPLVVARAGDDRCPAMVRLAAGWSDIGSWSALLELDNRDVDGNVTDGDVYLHDCHGSLVLAQGRLVAALGIDDLVVVETADAVLVAPKGRTQEVRKIVAWLKSQGRMEGINHRRVYRPWGSFEQLDSGERYQVKRLTVKPGAVLSLQMHHHRAEHWVVVRGTARVTRGEENFLLSENQSTYIPIGTKHRLENPGKVDLEVIEAQSGSYLGEDDIVRFEDRYNR